jgi:cytochrome c-type biogenesis protein CcmH
MTVFVSIAVLLTLLVVVWVVRPLLWPAAATGVSSQGLNIAIYRDQLLALERDLARGTISQADYEATKDEVQLRLLDDTVEPATGMASTRKYFWTGRRSAVVIALLFFLGAGGLYNLLGAPGAINPVIAQKARNDEVERMVTGLAERLKANPDNPKGWAILARSYKVMGRLDDAEQAFLKAGDLINTEPDLMVDYADLLAVRANNNIEGKPLALVNKALVINPQHPMGLMMAGVAAYRRSDFKAAMAQWEKLKAVLEPDSPDAEQVAADIADARAKAGLPPLPLTAQERAEADLAAGRAKPGQAAPVNAIADGAMTPEKSQQMVDRLAARLKSNPGDLAGWAQLARAYKMQGQLDKAEQAYAKTGKLLETDADVLTQYADLLAMRANNQIEGRPLALINKALALNPKHPMALMMAGTAAYRRTDYAQAVTYWETVLAVLEPGSSDATQVRAEIADARAKTGIGSLTKTKP